MYLSGLVIAQPLRIFGIEGETISLAETFITFLLFLLLLPSWITIRWVSPNPYLDIGLSSLSSRRSHFLFFRGILISLLLLTFVLLPMRLGGWLTWSGDLNVGITINALILGLGVGFAEELIFRGWLFGELNRLFRTRFSLFIQAGIFSLAHTRISMSLGELITLFCGLLLLALALGIRRLLDNGSLWGCIGIHGGLVGFWFLINNGLFTIDNPNPLPFDLVVK